MLANTKISHVKTLEKSKTKEVWKKLETHTCDLKLKVISVEKTEFKARKKKIFFYSLVSPPSLIGSERD